MPTLNSTDERLTPRSTLRHRPITADTTRKEPRLSVEPRALRLSNHLRRRRPRRRTFLASGEQWNETVR